MTPTDAAPPRIVIVGAGYVGLYAAMKLQRKLRRGEAHITVIDPESYMTYQPFLPETAAGNIEPRHIAIPLRPILKKCQVINGHVTSISHAEKLVSFTSLAGEERQLEYDILIASPGSVTRTLPVPGLAEQGIGIKTIGEAVWLRNHILTRLDIAASTSDEEVRRRALTFVVVGGGFAGAETLAELESLTKVVVKQRSRGQHPGIHAKELRWVLVEAAGRILPEVGEEMGKRAVALLAKRGIDIRLNTRVESALNGHVVLSDGTEFETDTLIWTAGVKSNPVLNHSDLPLDERKRVKVDVKLRVEGAPGAWSAGDCAAVPDLTGGEGAFCTPSAQHAMREASRLAKNIVATIRGTNVQPYKHKNAGSVAGLGLHRGVAQIYGVKMRGPLAWLVHRGYHLAMVPTISRKSRILTGWMLNFLFKRDSVALGEIHQPREEFVWAATGTGPHPLADDKAKQPIA